MANVIVCYKWVIDEKDIRMNPDRSVDTSRAQRKISEYDKNAIEAGIRAAAKLGASPVGLTFGGTEAKQSLKDALSRGLEAVYWIGHPAAGTADGLLTARVLAAAAEKIGDYSLIVCGEGASDTYARQVGPRLGALLDLPVVTAVCDMEIDGEQLIATRKLEDCIEKVKVSLPAVISVLPEINEAPVPTLKAVLAAGKKPSQEFTLQSLGLKEEELQPGTSVTGVLAYVMDRKNVILKDGDVATRVKEFVTYLKKEGVI
ncbi:MAG: electron transfer flavoprotein beta subunit [Moorella sp. (in: firmicutes)]|jgi:electron transfer flavoprotein beta subunit|uniref:electron transfer flavoprotein subunit beta/FixA family protein n=1 Tax=unclassified Neomoorella TaxID=2676739 RepID=UPI0010FFAB1C|nr:MULTISPECIES: electron transfer flavoprotein beta subunit/FixA family protein [unclassified Moorella (in: firmicutes)]MDK2816956.1 electron transfer flavoprotein beta subunit [Moorella sp. (in: firmicutes)]GEA14726.1 electron transfer flavoprotein FixB [Moorella sp. E308F]GEA17900.1 electron transfer flavoprotein FixB [Moorella sp. E306M]